MSDEHTSKTSAEQTNAGTDLLQRLNDTDPNDAFAMDKDTLRLELITTQYALRQTRRDQATGLQASMGLLVLVNGMETAGKGQAVTQLRQWVDPRLLHVAASVGHVPSRVMPLWQPHTQQLPQNGDVAVYFGNWYADLLCDLMQQVSHALQNKHHKQREQAKIKWTRHLRQQLAKLSAFEADLVNNNVQLLKCWFHVDMPTLHQRLNDDVIDPVQLYQMDWQDRQLVASFNDIANHIIAEQGDWVVIDGRDQKRANGVFCQQVLKAMQRTLHIAQQQPAPVRTQGFAAATVPEQLLDIDDPDMDKSNYKKQLNKHQKHVAKLLRQRGKRHVIMVFEGMDAAGKGGAIKRLVAPLDPREYTIYNIASPSQEALAHPYLWRFWQKLPQNQCQHDSRITIFDRSWYGRVLVERVEGFASTRQWQRAYNEINRFEYDLIDANAIVLKFWLAIDKDTQLKRFEARQDTPHKQYKLTDEDWRNRDKWADYVQAASDMLTRTSTQIAPWCVVATNDKRTARLQVLQHTIDQLSRALEQKD